ncbi:DNA topoisomerase II [Coprinopsis marcescibilis]|uniref:DNA topoisomerase 2 n=1 Tax=Coprinopsis marcescibilis TaxID=230819 RepID=A0A5C3LD20_COPMA|nr:DNA topoisomerase II [Coprinopsis marcescibilis]
MSSSGGEDFDFGNNSASESDDYGPAKKTATKAKAPTKPKAKPSASSTKPKAAPRKKKAVASDDDSDMDAKPAPKAKAKPALKKKAAPVDSDSDMDEDGPAPRTQAEGSVSGPSKKKSASEQYQKLTQLEHILKRPDSYIGSIETITQPMWAYDAEAKRMVHRDVKYVPGFFKIVDEILVNAADNKINDKTMDTLKVSINVEEGTISVFNNGRGIPIEIHSKEGIYIPEMIFGHLLSSSNYDDDEKKLTGGRNGYGAKLANIYSLEFSVETADKNTQQKYKQTWTDNMSKCGKAKITKNSRGEEFTKITFRPDLKRFGMEEIDSDTLALLNRRVYDMAGTIKDVKVFLNDERLKIKNFRQYVDMYVNAAQEVAAEKSGGAAQAKHTIVHEQISDRWEIAYTLSTDGAFQHVSFANSIATTKGGTHVTYLADQIAKNLLAAIAKKNKNATVKNAQIKNHMWLFVNCLIENPTFDSQTKELMTLPSNKFGSKPVISENFIKKVQNSGIVENVLNWAKFKADQQIKKTDGTKRSRLLGLTKLADANNAGTRHAKDCTLILTEGDSAKALAIAGLGVVGRDNFGVFPLRGKLLNVREARHDQIMKNEEIQNIKKILGLQHNKDYTDSSSLRYGQLMIMTDQDHDGSHIKGLIINFLDHFYPSLLKIPGFLVEFVTPIVRVKKGNKVKDFFTIPEYEQWLEDTPDARKWESKYYKGLGTSEDKDARDYFSKMEKHMIPFGATQNGDRELIELAFSKKKADDRKEWLRNFKPGTYLDHRLEEIPYSEFINKELILFSMADNIRSIPSIADGLKPGQRKVIWGCFKRKLRKEIKVAQLVGYISEHAAYHHGEASLAATIINLAQEFVGSNNLALLMPSGQYGTRDMGGKDHAAPRYIFTGTKSITRAIYHPGDDPLLTYLKDDDASIEPEWYMPTVPTVLINGAEGIGTGWSTNIPPFNPSEIVANIRRLMNGEEMVPMMPWWRGFKGEVKMTSKGKFDVTGIAKKVNDTTVEISELPIHKWTNSFKESLEAMISGEKKDKEKDKENDDGSKKDKIKHEGMVKDFKEHHDNLNVLFEVMMTNAKDLDKAEEKGLIEFFGLTSKVSTTNMILFDFDGKIKKYDTPEEILEEFYPMRLAYYQKRKDYQANTLETAYDKLNNQIRFIEMIVDKQLTVSGRKKIDIVADLRKHKFRPFPKVAKTKVAKDENEDDDEDEDDDDDSVDAVTDFDYLLGMAIYSLTREKTEKLRQQAKEKEAELMILLRRSPKDLWNEDLDKFMEEWEEDCRIFEQKKGEGGANAKKKKQKTLRTRKSIGFGKKNGKDSDGDDFVPIKATAGAKSKSAETKKPRAAPKASSSTKIEDVVEEKKPVPKRAAAAAARKIVLGDSDSSDDDFAKYEVKAPPKEKGKAKAPALKTEVMEIYDDSEPPKPPQKAVKKPARDEDSDPPAKKKATAAVARKRKVVESDSDDAIEVLPPAKKQKSPALSDSDDDAKPAMKKKVTDFFSKTAAPKKISKSMKPASPLKKLSESSDGDGAPRRKAGGGRHVRTARTVSKQYVEIISDESGGDGSMFVDDDD